MGFFPPLHSPKPKPKHASFHKTFSLELSGPQCNWCSKQKAKKDQRERKYFCPGIVQIHPSPGDYPNYTLQE